MKVHLMAEETDFDPIRPQSALAEDLAQDLQLDYLWQAMANGDALIRKVVEAAVLRPVSDARVIRYRQHALADVLAQRETAKRLYQLAGDATEAHKHLFVFALDHHPRQELDYAVRVLEALTEHLDTLRALAPSIKETFTSDAFQRFSATIRSELDDTYMARLRSLLRALSFRDGKLFSAGIGNGGIVSGQVLRRGREENRHLFHRIPLKGPLFSFTLPERDEAGANALAELEERSLNEVANVASQALEHVQSFFATLQIELAFYLGCANLADRLAEIGVPTCVPEPAEDTVTEANGLYDPCLALRTNTPSVGNDVNLGDSNTLVITGANRGGKSTLLRALGTAQLLMQAGIFAPAKHFRAKIVGQVYSHWAREEDAALVHGKFDEELERMQQIISVLRPGDLLLCNETFASTNEAEGSQILLEVTQALSKNGVGVRSVTHLYDFAIQLAGDPQVRPVFLLAPRDSSGSRSYRLLPGAPRPTSFGLDLYDQVFGTKFGVDNQ